MKTLWLEARANKTFLIAEKALKELPKELALFTTVQYMDSFEPIKAQLEKAGIIIHVIDGKHVCRLIILASPRPVFLNQGKAPKFYLRTGGGTRDLNIQEAVEFIAHRWKR